MKRVAYEEMVAQFTRVLEKHGFTPSDAKDAAVIFAQNSLSGVYSHAPSASPAWAVWSAGTATAASAR